jgi:hypothetical protein
VGRGFRAFGPQVPFLLHFPFDPLRPGKQTRQIRVVLHLRPEKRKPRINLRVDTTIRGRTFRVQKAVSFHGFFRGKKPSGSLEIPKPARTRLALRLFEIAGLFVRLDHVASFIVNADHSIM